MKNGKRWDTPQFLIMEVTGFNQPIKVRRMIQQFKDKTNPGEFVYFTSHIPDNISDMNRLINHFNDKQSGLGGVSKKEERELVGVA